jgi:DNA-binding CsgD family transcriptional regulator
VDLASRVARLTAGQRECLDLVDDHATSKEIARQLGISRHTVDARLRGAIQTLGVTSRREAAVIYRAAQQAETYQPFAYQSPRIVTEGNAGEYPRHEDRIDQLDAPEGSDGDFPRPDDADLPAAGFYQPRAVERQPAGFVSDSAVWTAVPPAQFPVRNASLRLWGGANDLNPGQRLAGILVVTILAMLAFGVFLSGIEALSLLRS